MPQVRLVERHLSDVGSVPSSTGRDGTGRARVDHISTKLSSLRDKAAVECVDRDFPQARFVNKPRSQPMRFGFCRM
jgi:hypothetical protein